MLRKTFRRIMEEVDSNGPYNAELSEFYCEKNINYQVHYIKYEVMTSGRSRMIR